MILTLGSTARLLLEQRDPQTDPIRRRSEWRRRQGIQEAHDASRTSHATSYEGREGGRYGVASEGGQCSKGLFHRGGGGGEFHRSSSGIVLITEYVDLPIALQGCQAQVQHVRERGNRFEQLLQHVRPLLISSCARTDRLYSASPLSPACVKWPTTPTSSRNLAPPLPSTTPPATPLKRSSPVVSVSTKQKMQ